MKGIYKFQNKVNNKVYIGQSVNIEKRYGEHFHDHQNPNYKGYDTKFYRALRKYGIDNFSFEIVESNPTDLNEAERRWVAYYNSYDDGYNSNKGGESVTEKGELHPNAKLNNQQVKEIKRLLKETKTTQKDIGKMFDISSATITQINRGVKWNDVNETYPLRGLHQKPKGSEGVKSIFSEVEVMEIRNRYVNESGTTIYKDYQDKCSYTTFERILIGKTYTDLPIYKKKEKVWIN